MRHFILADDEAALLLRSLSSDRKNLRKSGTSRLYRLFLYITTFNERSSTGSLLTQEIASSCYDADRWLCSRFFATEKTQLDSAALQKIPESTRYREEAL